MKRIINIRPFLIAFASLMLGIVAYTFLFLSDSLLHTVLGVAISFFAVCLLGVVIWAFSAKKQTNINAYVVAKRFVFLIALVAVLVGGLFMGVRQAVYNSTLNNYEGSYYVVGDIEDDIVYGDTYTLITLRNVVLNDNVENYVLRSGLRVIVYATDIGHVDGSYTMEFQANIEKVPFENSGYNFYNYNNKTVYSATVLNNSYNFYEDEFDLDEGVRNAYYEALQNNLPIEDANLAYAMLFGQDQNLSQTLEDMFSQTGVTHILAVSGLHVGVLVALLVFVLGLFHFQRDTKLYITAFVLLAYAYLCGFSPSVVRASIMSLVLLYAFLEGRRFDAVSALSFAGIIILLINPLQLFALGFQLSFVALFAIITLVPYANKLLQKTKLPNWVTTPIATTLVISVMTMPLLAYYFNQVAVYSIFANLVAVPLLSVAYLLNFVLLPFVILLPFLGIVLWLPEMLLHVSKLFLGWLSALPGSTITVFSDGYITLLCLLLLAFVIKFVMTKPWIKTIVVLLLLSFAVGSVTYYNIPVVYYDNTITVSYQTNSNVNFVTTTDGEHILVGVALSEEEFETLVNNLRIKKIDTVIAYDYGYKYQEFLLSLCNDYGVNKIYFANTDAESETLLLQTFAQAELMFLQNNVDYYGSDYSILPYVENDVLVGVQMTVGSSTIFVLRASVSATYLNMLRFEDLPAYDLITSNGTSADLAEYGLEADSLVSSVSNQTTTMQVVNLKEQKQITKQL